MAYHGTETHCPAGHEWNEKNTYTPPSGAQRRQCRECGKLRRRAKYRKDHPGVKIRK
jgi:hypothetical protein